MSRAIYVPPKVVQENAKEALECIKNGSTAMTSIGRARAKQLASGKPVSIVTIRKMAQFNRHRSNATFTGNNPCKDNGYVAWMGWGGDEGVAWAKAVLSNYK